MAHVLVRRHAGSAVVLQGQRGQLGRGQARCIGLPEVVDGRRQRAVVGVVEQA